MFRVRRLASKSTSVALLAEEQDEVKFSEAALFLLIAL